MSGAPALERFRRAQDDPDAGFEAALGEIRSGGKQGHWIWYVFPQLAGLGSSAMSRAYGIRDAADAEAYLGDPLLGPRLVEMTRAVAEQLRRGKSIDQVMGSRVDVLKLVSSLTLFGDLARRGAVEGVPLATELAALASEVLDAARGAGVPPCAYTRGRIG